MKTNLKCKGCNIEIPKESLDKEWNPTWFGMYRHGLLIQWICVECWKKGIRYSK